MILVLISVCDIMLLDSDASSIIHSMNIYIYIHTYIYIYIYIYIDIDIDIDTHTHIHTYDYTITILQCVNLHALLIAFYHSMRRD